MPPSSSSNSSTDGYDLVLRLLLGVLAVVVPFAHFAWLSGNITAYLTGADWAPYQPTAALLHPEQVWPGTGETSLLIGARIVPVLLLLALAVAGGVVWARHKSRSGGREKKIADMAKARDIEPLMARAITDKARSLRPSLKDAKNIDAKDTGILLGNLQGTRHEVRMGFEDVAVAIMAPRSGKTTSLAIPSILHAPGPVLLTSNKAAGDAFTTAYEARAKTGQVWTMDPQQIAHAAREMWWNPLAGATTLDGANRLAGHFLAASVDASQQGDFWSKAGSNILSQLLLAAALDERPITDIMQWLAFPADRTPLDILRDHGFAAVAAQLKGTVEGPPETRDGIYETARQYAATLLNSEIAAWVTPQKGVPEFQPAQFVTSTDTLFLLSKDGGGGASALIAACADSVMRAATAQAERAGGRLDPPMLAILDEAANVCKISDLPDLYSHLGSRGIIPITILQSYRQGQKVWGDAGMDAMWSASTVKVIGSGIDDPDFADKLSRLIGDHDVETTSTSHSESGKSTSVSMRQERILPPDAIRALPKGTALCFATGMRAAMLDLRPWYLEPGADELSAASDRASKAITARAIAKHALQQGDYDTAA
ncbi:MULTISPECIES: type IV secretory system conjugative DNA transfer family protein [Streptomyces]|uniref:Type IV secretory system conjugative DNA transfer family protein n=4 Tax=Streptomyces TaxID=1883 RepID=A0ABW9I9A6_STRGJ|nr:MULTISPECIES: type IV secretory system conjugative DNA transfer family protein [Streptomyces]MBP5861459.1 TraM recognition domain-containing protein [Streptomyces sp. LBUM 1484]MBP5869611.1 TraM recognition domain-containing protein [Streptomyces sp. LBUM 1485]MBP5908022.1 TraM recognition domain-containing protein [Streptomyces sp. LBUM 1478]MBP5929001.1 TraM recognition domain-containing protein [Streptomyces sp. LBUM 1479]KFG02851.1 membrane protein [Streptomyces scabiei]